MRVEPFWALSIVLAQILYTATGDPARWPGFPQPWCTGMVTRRQGSVRINWIEDVSAPSLYPSCFIIIYVQYALS